MPQEIKKKVEGKIVTFSKSDSKNKKYKAQFKVGGSTKTLNFGDKRYEQYHDKIGMYKNLDHNDPERR